MDGESLETMVARIDERVKGLDEKFDSNTLVCTKCIEGLSIRVSTSEKRIRNLELFQAKAIGMVLAVGAGFSAFASWIFTNLRWGGS